nr:sushi, von Willebrand factor type A, EGF and pentraxin domain-containing protein 1-like isoform X2 [Lepeophtheirus salmonis]
MSHQLYTTSSEQQIHEGSREERLCAFGAVPALGGGVPLPPHGTWKRKQIRSSLPIVEGDVEEELYGQDKSEEMSSSSNTVGANDWHQLGNKYVQLRDESLPSSPDHHGSSLSNACGGRFNCVSSNLSHQNSGSNSTITTAVTSSLLLPPPPPHTTLLSGHHSVPEQLTIEEPPPGYDEDPHHSMHPHSLSEDVGSGGRERRGFLCSPSLMVKISKLNVRSGLYKVAGEFGLRENVYYGLIFVCMTLIVIFCFLVINRTTAHIGFGGFGSGGSLGSGSSQLHAIFDVDQNCELLMDPVHGKVHQTGRNLGDRAIYTCTNGWEIVGVEERVCQSDGHWSNEEPYCKKRAIKCSEPEEVLNGDVDRKCQTFGCRISYQCRAGYELQGRQHRYCQADGSWSPRMLPQCVPIQCPLPQNPINGRAVYASVSYNSLISYECNYGYMLIGDSVRRCERNKQWTGTEPHCKEINCGSPGILPNGWLEGTRTTLHAVVTFRCQEGMTFEGPSYRTICQADGRWSHPLPRCFAPCVVPHISHGFVADRASGSSVPHTNTIDVQCLSQFQKTHDATPICKNGTWSRVPKCIPAKCRELPDAPQNGMVVAPNLEHGMVGKFECRDGYMLKGNNTTQCFFGNWTGMTPWCKEVFCPFPGFVENGKILLVGNMGLYEYRPYVRKIRNNRQIMYQCNRGYVLLNGPTGATCIDGTWSPPQLPRCQEEAHAKSRYSRESILQNSTAATTHRHRLYNEAHTFSYADDLEEPLVLP